MKMAFAGSGMIGAGLAVNALIQGHDVAIYDVVDVETIRENINKVMHIMIEAGAIISEVANQALKCVTYTNNLAEAVQNAVFLQECVPERIELKRSIYHQVQEICGKDIIIASSTSAIMPSVLQEGALYPENIVVGHPYNPSYLLPLIEVCGGDRASDETIQSVMEIYRNMGKKPVYCRKEAEGFIVNKISWAAMDVAKKLVLDGVCSVEDMDAAIMYGPGMRMAVTGQILTMSLGIQGGLRAAAAKYGKEPNEEDCILADGVDEEISNRTEEQGNTVDTVEKYRDKMFVKILKAQKIL